MYTLLMCSCKYLSNGPLDKWSTGLASPVYTLIVVLWVAEVVSFHALTSSITVEVKELQL